MSILVFAFLIAMLRAGKTVANFWGCILTFVCLIPHEFLHAFCFKGDVFMYNNMKQGSLFVNDDIIEDAKDDAESCQLFQIGADNGIEGFAFCHGV